MIVLEIQALSLTREGLLVDVGRVVVASGFALVRQRLVDDANGVLLTMVVRGLARKQKMLESALAEHERVVSFEVFPFVEGAPRPHFAAARSVASSYVPPPPPEARAMSEAASVRNEPASPSPSLIQAPDAEDLSIAAMPLPTIRQDETESPLANTAPESEYVLFRPSPSALPAEPAVEPFVETIALQPDVQAIEQVFSSLTAEYPRIYPWLAKLEQSVQQGARESSLQLIGQRLGAWLFEREHQEATSADVNEVLNGVVVPALRRLVDVEHKANQLHIHDSPLCEEGGHGGCAFYIGYLEGMLAPVVPSDGSPIIAMCCRSCGADECVLAVMA